MKHTFEIFEDIEYSTLIRFSNFIKSLSMYDEVDLYICSYGGDIFSGNAIFQMIQGFQHNNIKFNALVYGLCASAASDIALCCDKIGMASTAAIMIHSAYRNDGDVDRGIELANAAQLSVIKKRLPGYNSEDLQKDKWFSAKEAIDLGLVDYIFDDIDSKAAKIAAKLTLLHGGAKMARKAEEIKKEELVEEMAEDEIIEEVEEKKESEPENNENMPSVDDVLEEIVKKLEENSRRFDEIEKRLKMLEGGEVEAECGDRENARMKAVFDRIQSICKPAQAVKTKVSDDPQKDLKKHKEIYANANFDSYINKD